MKQQPSIDLVLASQSIRRYELLQQIGFDPLRVPVELDETPENLETPRQLVARLARLKAIGCQRLQQSSTHDHSEQNQIVILAADTIIDLDGQALGKPIDKAQAISTLIALSDREHSVHSGVCALNVVSGFEQTITVSSQVRFGEISPTVAERYWNTGEPIGKAGSYAIQGLGAQFVAHLSGSYSNVVGLPLFETAQLLKQAGLKPL